MPLPENDEINNETADEIADDALIAPSAADAPRRKRFPLRVWIVLGLLAAIPLGLTLYGALTAPPHLKAIPYGHLAYLEADQISDRTTTLRGLYLAGPDGRTRLLLHENEAFSEDAGPREWITQPSLSPDGRQVAFEKQLITLKEEKQTIQNQIWIMPTAAPLPESPSGAHLLVDLSATGRKQAVGIAWDSDESLMLLQDESALSLPLQPLDPPLKTPLDLHGLTLQKTPTVSATRHPALTEAGSFAYGVETPAGPRVLVQRNGELKPGPAASLWALSPKGDTLAYAPLGTTNVLRVFKIAAGKSGPELPVRWGWSVFGKRQITSLRWGPNGDKLAFTVSKPPVPDDEIFILDLATGRTMQLPYRTGRAAWDWGR